jgi:hypothetical protein
MQYGPQTLEEWNLSLQMGDSSGGVLSQQVTPTQNLPIQTTPVDQRIAPVQAPSILGGITPIRVIGIACAAYLLYALLTTKSR